MIFNPVVVFENPGTYEVNLFVTDSVCLITDTAQIQILVLDSLLLDLNDTISLCSSAPYLLMAQTYGTANQFIWSTQPNLNPPLNNPQDSTALITQNGWYYCQVSNGLCTALDSVFVQFDTPLQALFSIADTIGCAPLVLQIQNSSSTTTSFLWDFGNGVFDSLTFEPTLTYTQPGIYQLSLQISDSICQGTATFNLQVNVGPALEVTAPADLLLCSAIDTTLIPIILGAPSSIVWSSNNNFSDTLNSNNSPNLTLIDPQNAWYYIEVSSAYCSASDSVLISIQAQDLEVESPSLICADVPFTASIFPNPNFQQITWSPASVVQLGQGQPTVTVALSSPQYLYVTVETAQNCQLQDSVFINVSTLNPLSVTANANPLVILPNTSTQLLGQPTGAYTYNWSPSQNLSSATTQNPTALLDQTTLFTLTVSDGLCSGSDTVLVKVYDSICQAPFVYIPNAFSPNKDGSNDKLYVRGQYIFEFVFRVYDRWGELVWETSNINDGWDGTYRGKLLDPDVYDYYLQVTCIGGLENIIKGNVTLIR